MSPGSPREFTPEYLLRVLRGLPTPPRYWVGFSGGLDSSVLLHALDRLRPELGVPVHVIHVDHGLQPESRDWAEFCRRTCERLALPMRLIELDLTVGPGDSLEAVAREARLGALKDCLGPGDMLLAAQHADDQAETLMLQLLRGSGVKGLAAMPLLSDLPPGLLSRPLLACTREQLSGYARRHGLAWVDDPSNLDLRFDRNYLRRRVMPLLAERWPSHAHTLSRSARHCAEAADLLEDFGRELVDRARGGRRDCLSVAALCELKPVPCRALLRQWIQGLGFKTPDSVHLERIRREVLTAASDRSPLVAWEGAEVRRYRDDLFLLRPLPEAPLETIFWPASARRLELPEGMGWLERTDGTASVDLHIRFQVPGAECRRGARTPTRLKKLYQEAGVADWLRPYIPLLYAGDELMGVADIWACGDHPGAGIRWRGHRLIDLLPRGLVSDD